MCLGSSEEGTSPNLHPQNCNHLPQTNGAAGETGWCPWFYIFHPQPVSLKRGLHGESDDPRRALGAVLCMGDLMSLQHQEAGGGK